MNNKPKNIPPKKRTKGIKKVLNGGNLTQFKDFVLYHREQKSDFKVTSRGMSRIVEFNSGKKVRFFGQAGVKTNNIEGAFFVRMVKTEIDKFIEVNGGLPKKEPVISQTFNCSSIKKVLNKPICYLDLNLCYWRTAYLLGYISTKLYNRGLDSGFKKGMLVSIGALNANPLIQQYEDGKVVYTKHDDELNAKYSPFYWSIIGKVNDLMMEVFKELGDDFYMWLTDCAFIAPERQGEVMGIFEKYGFPYKSYTSDFTYCDDNTVEWYDCKDGRLKTISVGGRHIKPLFVRWDSLQHFYEENTILETKN